MERNIDQINVIPLVDVMLVLLVIVLTTATFISTGQIPVNLAKAKEVGDRKDVPIVISLTADGSLFFFKFLELGLLLTFRCRRAAGCEQCSNAQGNKKAGIHTWFHAIKIWEWVTCC